MSSIKIRVIDCHIAFYNDQKSIWEFLLIKRSKNTVYGETWQGVTGKIENTEIPYEAALRELKEETGLNAIKLWTIDKVNTFYDAIRDVMNLIPVFGVTVNSKKVVLSKEHVEYKWCTINQAVKLLTWDQQKKGIKIFHDMLCENKNRLKFMEIEI